jgi:hypothetical protein
MSGVSNSSNSPNLSNVVRFTSPRKAATALEKTPTTETIPAITTPTTDQFHKTTTTDTSTPTVLDSLPAPAKQIINSQSGNTGSVAPQIYVINTAPTTAPPVPSIDMEVDTTTAQPQTNALGLTSLLPTTSVSVHEGAGGGHHAEGHHSGGGFNWFNSVFPFPVGGGEGFDWWGQATGGAALGAVGTAMANLIGLAYQDDYLGPIRNSLRATAKKLDGTMLGLGTLLSAAINLPLDIFNTQGIVRTMFDDASQRRYKIILKPVDGVPAYAEVSNIGGFPAQVGITGGYSDFARIIERKGEGNAAWNWINNTKLAKQIGIHIPSESEARTCVLYPDLEHFGKESLVRFIGGDIEFNVNEQKYMLSAVEMLTNGANKKLPKVNIEFIWDAAKGLYTTQFSNNTSIENLTKDKQATLQQLTESGLKALHEIAPLASELLGGKGQKQAKNAMQHFLDDVLFKYLPGRAMLLGAFIGGALAVKAGYYEMGHKHLSIESHGGGSEHGGKTARPKTATELGISKHH